MIYVGHFRVDGFSNDAINEKDKGHGRMTCVAEAQDVDEALTKMEDLIRSMGDDEQWFDNGTKIYLDSCVEVRQMPAQGLITEYFSTTGDDPGGVRVALMGAPEDAAVSYAKDVILNDKGPQGEPPFIEY